MKSRRTAVSRAIWPLFLTSTLFAQLNTADILGTVTDPAGAVMPNAKITIVNRNTADIRTVQTESSGDYVVNLLPSGTYSVTIEATSFKRHISTVTLVAGDR